MMITSIATLLCCATLLLFGTFPASAQSTAIGLDPDVNDGENLFVNMGEMLPGASVTDYFTVKNISNEKCTFYLQADQAQLKDFGGDTAAMQLSQELLGILKLRVVVHKADAAGNLIPGTGVEIYNGKADHLTNSATNTLIMGNRVELDKLDSKAALVIEASVKVPQSLDNTYDQAKAKFWWHISCEGSKDASSSSKPVSSSKPAPSSTKPKPSSKSSIPTSKSGSGSISSSDNRSVPPPPPPVPGSSSVPAVTPITPVPSSEVPSSAPAPSRSRSGSGTSVADSSESTIIEDPEVPIAPLGGYWSFLNLVLTVLGVAASLVIIGMLVMETIRKRRTQKEEADLQVEQTEEDKYKDEGEMRDTKRRRVVHRLARIVSSIVGLVMVVIFLLTQNMKLEMRLVDRWTPLMVALAIVQLVFIVTSVILKRVRPDEEMDDSDSGPEMKPT